MVRSFKAETFDFGREFAFVKIDITSETFEHPRLTSIGIFHVLYLVLFLKNELCLMTAFVVIMALIHSLHRLRQRLAVILNISLSGLISGR